MLFRSGLCIEAVRQTIFERREKLFDLAAQGSLDFKSEEYRQLRDHLNKSIRFAHEMSFWKFVINWAAMRKVKYSSPSPSIPALLKSINDPATRDSVSKLLEDTSAALLIAMAARSLPTLILAFVAWIVSRLGIMTGINRILLKGRRAVQREVEFAAP